MQFFFSSTGQNIKLFPLFTYITWFLDPPTTHFIIASLPYLIFFQHPSDLLFGSLLGYHLWHRRSRNSFTITDLLSAAFALIYENSVEWNVCSNICTGESQAEAEIDDIIAYPLKRSFPSQQLFSFFIYLIWHKFCFSFVVHKWK